ncbi:hypothetical protein [Microbulbifer pacificus]|uniref:hypothetical protein n=1 Tax=Microbulbifer pacificus TaxID=407164 RepID=UPI001319DFCD|nr:hypothetical protein [Microbulbifer pacificus]
MAIIQQPLLAASAFFTRLHPRRQPSVNFLEILFEVTQIGVQAEVSMDVNDMPMAFGKGFDFFEMVLLVVRALLLWPFDITWSIFCGRHDAGPFSARKKPARTTELVGFSATQFHW